MAALLECDTLYSHSSPRVVLFAVGPVIVSAGSLLALRYGLQLAHEQYNAPRDFVELIYYVGGSFAIYKFLRWCGWSGTHAAAAVGTAQFCRFVWLLAHLREDPTAQVKAKAALYIADGGGKRTDAYGYDTSMLA